MIKPGWRHSEELKQKMREAHRGRKLSPETKAKLSASKRRFWTRIRKLQAEAGMNDSAA